MASCVNTHDFRVRICDAPETLIVRFVLSSRYLSERQTMRLLKNRLYASVVDFPGEDEQNSQNPSGCFLPGYGCLTDDTI